MKNYKCPISEAIFIMMQRLANTWRRDLI